ncbi:MAG: hypothetical protein OXG49_07460 [Chloroflexi bacterium]|nr:hypothetical protein [Chloroflexota bacterium]
MRHGPRLVVDGDGDRLARARRLNRAKRIVDRVSDEGGRVVGRLLPSRHQKFDRITARQFNGDVALSVGEFQLRPILF